MHKILSFLYAKFRGCAWLSCFDSPRPSVLRGWRRWSWLAQQRNAGRLIEPSVQFWCDDSLNEHLLLGMASYIDRGAIVWIGAEENNAATISLGERVYVGPYSFLGSCHRLTIGAETMIGANAYITTVNHSTQRRDIPYAQQGYEGEDVTIGKNVWIGCHVTILPGVTIGDNAIIGAGAVVTKNVPSGETWVGVPARRISTSEV
jgi:acetyltransferase-like isoleucine patch superfamily enzyme